MIKYPVAYGVNKFGLGHFVIDRNNQYVAEVNSEKDANLVANALNAINAAPKLSTDTTTWSSWGGWKGKYADWYHKYITKEII